MSNTENVSECADIMIIAVSQTVSAEGDSPWRMPTHCPQIVVLCVIYYVNLWGFIGV